MLPELHNAWCDTDPGPGWIDTQPGDEASNDPSVRSDSSDSATSFEINAMNPFAKHIAQAMRIQKSLGVRTAAGFLRNREFTLEEALAILVGGCRPCQVVG